MFQVARVLTLDGPTLDFPNISESSLKLSRWYGLKFSVQLNILDNVLFCLHIFNITSVDDAECLLTDAGIDHHDTQIDTRRI